MRLERLDVRPLRNDKQAWERCYLHGLSNSPKQAEAVERLRAVMDAKRAHFTQIL